MLPTILVAPKMISNLSPSVAKEVFGLDMAHNESCGDGDLQAELLIWQPILVAKFTQNPPMGKVLKDTAPALLVESVRFLQPAQYWSASRRRRWRRVAPGKSTSARGRGKCHTINSVIGEFT